MPETSPAAQGSADVADSSVLAPQVDEGARAEPVERGAPAPDLGQIGRALARPRARSAGITVLAVLAVLYTLYFARDFLLPITFALLLDFLFSPLVRMLARFRIRPPLGAGIVMAALVGLLGFGAYELSGPIQRWAGDAPRSVATAQERLRGLTRPLERVSRTAEQVEQATAVGGTSGPQRVVVTEASLVSRIFGTTQRFLTGVVEVLVLLYFLLAAGDLFLQKLVKVLPDVEGRRTAIRVARKTEASISTYLLAMLALNVSEGVVVALALWLLGMPNPLLWGALVAVLEFVPYLGAGTMVVLLGLASLTAFDSMGRALLMPAAFLAINVLWANLVAPLLLADRLTLNPVALFVGLLFWWWIWGIPGAFIAVPLLAAFKILCDHVESLAAIGEFLGRRDVEERRAIVR